MSTLLETKPFVYFDTAPLVQLYLYETEKYPNKASDALHLAALEMFKNKEPKAEFFITDNQQYRLAQLLYPKDTLAVIW